MRRAVLFAGFLFAMQFLNACSVVSSGTAHPDEIKSTEAAIVYGYVEVEDDTIERVDFIEYSKVYVSPFIKQPRVLVFDNGMFMAENIKPGDYLIGGYRSEHNHYNLSRSARLTYQRVYHIEPGEMRYLGSFHLRVTRQGNIEFGDLKVTEIVRPGEREILKHLYQVTEGTAWQNKIGRRLKELYQ